VTDGLDGRVLAFARALRRAGITVSTVEVTDALRALRALPLQQREAVRAGLAAALLKERTLRPAFDRLFDLYFPLRRSPAAPGPVPADAQALTDALQRGDVDTLRAIARQRVDEYGDVRPTARISEDAYTFRALRGLNLDAILSRLRDDHVVEGRGRTALERRVIHEDMEERMRLFRDMLREEVSAALLDHLGAVELATRQRRPPPDEVDFLWAHERDLDRMREALVPLARKLAARLSHQRRRARRGRLDLRRTIRRSLGTGGCPVEPRLRRPRAGKPEIVLLCDVSGSMRAFSRFTLELTYTLATCFQRVRAFVFVDALDEVTRMFEATAGFAAALDRIDREARVAELDGQSWYGNCLEQFWHRAGRDLAPHTTVVVVGDARTNFRTTGAEYLHRVADRVRAVYWLNPEPREHWDTGDSVMAEYLPACDAAFEVRNLGQLEAFARQAL